MEYVPEGGNVEKTLMLVGKGITYDTGGADIKAGGIMAGMSRDKGGASDVAGIVKTISMLKPKNLKVRMICRCSFHSYAIKFSHQGCWGDGHGEEQCGRGVLRR